MADDADVNSEITLEEFDGEQATPKAEPSTVKEAEKPDKPEVKGKEEKAKGDDTPALPDVPTKDKEAKPDEAEKPEGEAEPSKDKPKNEPQPKGAEERKTQLNTEIRDLVAQKNALKAEAEKQNAEVYQVATEDELVEGGMTELEAKVEAMRQEREMEKFNNQVADAQLTISSESDRVLRDFPLFNPDSEEYDKELAEEASGQLNSMLIIDPNTGQVIGSNGSIYQYYKTLARAAGISAAKGQLKGQQDTEQMLANADAGGAAAPPKKVEDPLMKLWAED